jgi:Recombinase
VRRVFEGLVATGSATKLVPLLRAEGVLTKTGRPFYKGSMYKLLNNRTYLEVAHKGEAYPGEHKAIVPRDLWDAARPILRESPRIRTNRNRSQTPALPRGLIFRPDGQAMSPAHTRRRGRLYRHYVSQAVLKGTAGDDCPVRRLPAAEIEAAVMEQVRALLRQPEVVVGTWTAARADTPDLTEAETREAWSRRTAAVPARCRCARERIRGRYFVP